MTATATDAATRTGWRARLEDAAFAPVDIGLLVWTRICFGLVVMWETYRYLDRGWPRAYWNDPPLSFDYWGFSWLQPLPPPGMELLWIAIGACGAAIALGWRYRIACSVFTVLFTYQFLLEAARYLNHFYLMALLGGILAVVPAHRRWSMDARRDPELRSDAVHAWTLWLLRFQLAVMYFGGAIAKMNADWIGGQPMGIWLSQRPDLPLVGQWVTERWFAVAISWGGLGYDLLIVPALLWRRTRWIGLLATVVFHTANAELFVIGVFPLMALALTLTFCDTGWPRRLAVRAGGLIGRVSSPQRDARTQPAPRVAATILALLAVFALVQVAAPFRHHLHPGDRNWNEQGRHFSWHMKLTSKSTDAVFTVTDPHTGERWTETVADHLPGFQQRKVTISPELSRQFAVWLADQYAESGYPDVEVTADIWVRLNGRPPAQMIDPTVDLVTAPSGWRAHSWILDEEHAEVAGSDREG